MDEVKANSLFEKVILPLRDDEYLDGDGLPRCKSCHTLRVYVSDDKTFCARCLCKCQSEQIEKEKELEAIRRNLEEFYDRQRLSLMGDRYKDCRLSTAVITEHNRAAYARAKRYVEYAADMRRENIGLYFYGDNSSGKTYITACICNELLRTAELYLQKFVSGRYSDIWNAPSTLKTDANLIDFDFQSLFANKNNVVANAQMLLIFRFIEQEVINAREKNKGGANLHTLIIADEAHLYIDPKFPIALDFFYSMSKRIRKYNGSFIPATQNIADWNANEELRGKTSAIIKNSQYSFIFKLSAPDMKDVLDIYKTGDSFNDEEQRMIISAVTGQTFFVGSTELRNCILVKAGDYTQSLFEERKEEETN